MRKHVRARMFRPGALKRWTEAEAAKRARIERVFEITVRRLREGEHGAGMVNVAANGMKRDETKAHDVKTKSFVADVERKAKLHKVMPKSTKVVRATMAGEAADGEISALLHEPEAREQSTTLGAGKPDGMKPRTAYCERCNSESHATSGHCAVLRRASEAAIRSVAVDYFGAEAVALAEFRERDTAERAREAMQWPASMDGDAAERPEDPDGPGDKTPDKERFNYRLASVPGENCGSCRFFVEPAACLKVEGIIRKIDVCDLFEPADRDDSEQDEQESEDDDE